MELSELMETPPTDVTGFGPPASDSGLPLPADADITAKKTGGCKTSTVEHSDSPTLRLGGKSNQSMGAELDPRDPAPGNYYHTDPMRPTRPRATPPDARDIGLPSTGRRAYSKLTGTLLATVAAAPVALAVRGFRGTASSPKTMGRVLVLLAMLSTASGWKLPSHYETIDGQITQRDDRTVDVGEEETEEMIRVSRVTTITEHESPITRDRRRLASSCNGWCVATAPPPCSSRPIRSSRPAHSSLPCETYRCLLARSDEQTCVYDLSCACDSDAYYSGGCYGCDGGCCGCDGFFGGNCGCDCGGGCDYNCDIYHAPSSCACDSQSCVYDTGCDQLCNSGCATSCATGQYGAAEHVTRGPRAVAEPPPPPTHPTRAHRAP